MTAVSVHSMCPALAETWEHLCLAPVWDEQHAELLSFHSARTSSPSQYETLTLCTAKALVNKSIMATNRGLKCFKMFVHGVYMKC